MGSNATTMRKEDLATPVPREEWDFDTNKDAAVAGYVGCPDDEIVYCYEYEYFRASGVSVFEVQDVLRAAAPLSIEKFYEEFITQGPPRALSTPDPARFCPWLALDRETRRRKLEKVRGYEAPRPSPVSSVGVEMLLDKDGTYHDRIESHWFEDDDLNTVTIEPLRIAWNNTNDDLVKAFRAWLPKSRPALPEGAEKTGKDSGVGLRAALKALGAMRLLEGMTIDAARRHTGRILGIKDGGLYVDGANWSNAKGLAKGIIKARADRDLEAKVSEKIDASDLTEQQRALVALYLHTQPRAILLRLLAISPKLILKRALLAHAVHGDG